MISGARIVFPYCAMVAIEAMPADACQHLYDCSGCGRRLAPKDGDCCVFCSYADTPCPPVQGD